MPDRKRRHTKSATILPLPSERDIAERAYQRWLARGSPIGDGHEDWYAAEAELLAEVHEPTAHGSALGRIRSALRRLGT